MNSSELSALLVLATVSSFTPGPNTALSTAMAANHGLRRAMRFVCAVPVGWGILFVLCATGLGGLVVAFPPLRWGIVVLGNGYLLWLASRLWGSGAVAACSKPTAPSCR
jgi:threonine/homoserine/homoserine lactone efflux protein